MSIHTSLPSVATTSQSGTDRASIDPRIGARSLAMLRVAIGSTLPIQAAMRWLATAQRRLAFDVEISEGTTAAVMERWRRGRCDIALFPAREAVTAGIKLIVTIAEGMPVRDAVAALEIVRAAGVRWIGPSTPGLAIPGKLKLGFLPDVSLAPGPLGIMAKSGTLSYEVCHRLVGRGLGQSLWVGVGGDPVKGTRFADLLPFMLTDPSTHGIVVIGEIGGAEEEELAAAMRAHHCGKPVYALIAGRTVREGITMGHAGAMIQGDVGTIASKTEALTTAGAHVFTRIRDMIEAVSAEVGKGEQACS